VLWGVRDWPTSSTVAATDLAALLTEIKGVEVLHTEINQLVVAVSGPSDGSHPDVHTQRVLTALQSGGVCFPTGTTWHGRTAIRFSVSNWRTDIGDMSATADAVAAAQSIRD